MTSQRVGERVDEVAREGGLLPLPCPRDAHDAEDLAVFEVVGKRVFRFGHEDEPRDRLPREALRQHQVEAVGQCGQYGGQPGTGVALGITPREAGDLLLRDQRDRLGPGLVQAVGVLAGAVGRESVRGVLDRADRETARGEGGNQGLQERRLTTPRATHEANHAGRTLAVIVVAVPNDRGHRTSPVVSDLPTPHPRNPSSGATLHSRRGSRRGSMTPVISAAGARPVGCAADPQEKG